MGDFATSDKYDVCLTIDREVLANEVGLARVVNISSLAAEERRINNVLFVQAEEVAVTDTKFVVSNFPLVSYWVSDFLTDVFDDNLFRVERLAGEEAVPVNFADPDFDQLWTLFGGSILHGSVDIIALVGLHVCLVTTPIAFTANTRCWLDLDVLIFLFLTTCTIGTAWHNLTLTVHGRLTHICHATLEHRVTKLTICVHSVKLHLLLLDLLLPRLLFLQLASFILSHLEGLLAETRHHLLVVHNF